MVLQITFENQDIFNIFSVEIESQVDTLNGFIANGRVIDSAVLIDSQGQRTQLPLSAFDGKPIGSHMRELETEYKKILSLLKEARRVDPKSVKYIFEIADRAIERANEIALRRQILPEKIKDISSRIDALQAKLQALKKK